MFDAKILLDSIGPSGKRLTTFVVTYPRFIHSEILTHRMLSRSSASSRAIPWERWKEIDDEEIKKYKSTEVVNRLAIGLAKYEKSKCYFLQPKCMKYNILTDPVIPIHWGAEQKGMQSGDEIENKQDAIDRWLIARDKALEEAQFLANLNVHKSLINRIVEPWMWITVIISATEWENFWALRCHPSAERHFQKIAKDMRTLYKTSDPQKLGVADWHLPFITEDDRIKLTLGEATYAKYAAKVESKELNNRLLCMISAGRCARVSYLTHDGRRDHQDDINLFEKLIIRDEGNNEPLHCYDSETDVLTSEGWKNWTIVTGKEIFCTLNLKTQEIEYQQAIDSNLGVPYIGNMCEIDTNNLNLLVTPKHKVLACLMNTIEGRKKNFENYKLYEIWTLEKLNHAYLKAGQKEFQLRDGKYSYNTLALFGFALGDGFYIKDGNWLGFHLKKQRKINYLYSLGFDVLKFNNDLYKIKYPFDFDLKENNIKSIPQSFLLDEDNYPIYEGLMNSDGSNHDSHLGFSNTSKILIDQFCQICVHLGYAFYVSGPIKDCYKVSVIQDWIKPEVNRNINYKAKINIIENWEGRVYCVTVPNSTLMIRRKGIPLWCGNSAPLEHVAMALGTPDWSGNFKGFAQFRKFFPNECVRG